MALYDKASLVLIPSGTKAGKVFSQKPVPSNDVLGDELVTNGTFDTDSDWDKGTGWTIANGVATATSTSATFQQLSINLIEGKTYKVSFEIKSYTSGTLNVDLGSSSSSANFTDDGIKIVYLESAGFNRLRFYGGNVSCSIDNVSVRRVVDGDFDFTRSSYATRVNSQGLIEKERSNLLLQSNSFDTTWEEQNGGDLTSGQSDKDGGTTAWKLESSSGTTGARIQQTISNSGVATYSIYAKAGTSDWLAIYCEAGFNDVYVYYDLANGVVGTSIGNNDITVNIEDCGSGWYRCIATFNQSITQVRNYIANADSNITTSVGDNIYIQDAQLEQGLVATDVIETTTSAVYTGITDNVPRLDYDGDCPSLLLEPQRQNKMAYSEGLKVDLGIQYKSPSVTLTPNSAESPDGNNNATKFDGGINNVADSYVGYTASTTHSFSLFLKAGTCDIVKMKHTATGSVAEITINLTSGTITNTTGAQYLNSSIVDYGNGWYRASITFTSGTTGYITRAQLGEAGYIYMYGWQLEQGKYATSYIPTYGTSVTRNGDVCNNAGDSTIFNDDEGVLYAELLKKQDNNDNFVLISINNADSNSDANSVTIGFDNEDDFYFRVKSPSGTYTRSVDVATANQYHKIALKYKSGDIGIWVNGVELPTSNTTFLFTETLDNLSFDYNGNGVLPFYGKCKSLLYFDKALTDTELADLTT